LPAPHRSGKNPRFAWVATAAAPALEVLVSLHGQDASRLFGFARFTIDARPPAQELAATDQRINRQTAVTVALLGDSGTAATDEFTGTELLAIIGRRMAGPARDRAVRLTQGPGFAATLDSHRGTVSRITLAVGSSRSINVCSTSSTS
jgi:hypothetical protein